MTPRTWGEWPSQRCAQTGWVMPGYCSLRTAVDKLAPRAIIWRVWGSPGNPLSIPSAGLGPHTDSALGGIAGPRPLRLRPAGRRKLRLCAHLPRGHPGDVGAPNRLVCCPPTPASLRILCSPADCKSPAQDPPEPSFGGLASLSH